MAGKGREENLIPQSERTKDEQREIARQGGIASGKARREKKIIEEAILRRMKANDLDEIADGMIARAKKSTRAAEVLRDTVDGKPKETKDINAEITGMIDDRREILKQFHEELREEWND